MNFNFFCHFLVLLNFTTRCTLFRTWNSCFYISTQFPTWGKYIHSFWYWSSKIKINCIYETKLQVWPIYSTTVTFMAFKLKRKRLKTCLHNIWMVLNDIRFFWAAFYIFCDPFEFWIGACQTPTHSDLQCCYDNKQQKQI